MKTQPVQSRPDYLETARKFFKERHPNAAVAFVAGSIVRGEATPQSDIDLVVLYRNEDFDDVHRYSEVYEGWPIEVFAQNIKAQDYFFDKDRKRGIPSMPSMTLEGVAIPEANTLSQMRKQIARDIIDAGPLPLCEKERKERMYHLTDLLDDLVVPRNQGELMGALSLLYDSLGDFYLRAHNKWSGRGKSLFRALKKASPEVADEYERAFQAAFAGGGTEKLIQMAEELLKPFGGRHWAGYKSKASDDWKSFDPVGAVKECKGKK